MISSVPKLANKSSGFSINCLNQTNHNIFLVREFPVGIFEVFMFLCSHHVFIVFSVMDSTFVGSISISFSDFLLLPLGTISHTYETTQRCNLHKDISLLHFQLVNVKDPLELPDFGGTQRNGMFFLFTSFRIESSTVENEDVTFLDFKYLQSRSEKMVFVTPRKS